MAQSAAAVLRRVLTADVSVALLQGETGTGVGAVAGRSMLRTVGARAFVGVDAAHLAVVTSRVASGRGSNVGTLFVSNRSRTSSASSQLLQL